MQSNTINNISFSQWAALIQEMFFLHKRYIIIVINLTFLEGFVAVVYLILGYKSKEHQFDITF
jgi:hypothetical protein